MQLSFNIFKSRIDLLNKINVFPIADGDTGRNLNNIIKNIETIDFISLEDYLLKAAKSAIMNGTGCSGNIFSLYLLGLSQNYTENFSEMCKRAAQFTWNTMYEPVEGTILTAMKDVPLEYSSLEDFLYKYIQNTYKNLMKGPDLLSILKESKTLDSGTLGFLYILCDFYKNITGVNIAPNFDSLDSVYVVNSNINDRYCIEINLIVKNGNLKFLLSEIGSELIYLPFENRVKFHIHSNDYISVISLCKENGEILDYKIEDMINNNHKIYL